MSPIALIELSKETISSSLSFSNIYFWMGSGYFDNDAYTKPLLHTWSLGVEEQFYLIWPIVLLLLFKFKKYFIYTLFALIFSCSLYFSQIYAESSPASAFFLLPFRVFQFLIGGAAVFLPRRINASRILSEVSALLGILLMAVAAFTYTDKTLFPGINALYPSIGALLCILFGNNGYTSKLFLANPISRFIGEISYSLYLVHWPIIVFFEYIALRNISIFESIIAFIIMIILAYFMFTYIETPTRKRKNNGSPLIPSKALVSICVAASISVAAIAYLSIANNGWPWRVYKMPVELASFQTAKELHTKLYGGVDCSLQRCETQPNTNLPKIFVIGDSHARALYQGLKTHISDYNFVIFGPNSCPMYSFEFTTNKDVFSKACTKVRKAAYDEISKSSNPVVILHQHWSPRLTEKIYNSKNKYKQHSFKSAASTEKGVNFILNEAEKLKDKLNIKKLYILGGIPRYGAPLSPLDCLTRPIKTNECLTSNLNSRVIKVQHSFNEAANKYNSNKISFIDPYNYFCDVKRCINTLNGYPLYSDSTHLSVWGSDYMIEKMSSILRRE